jgi:hypothetical protein
LDATSLYAKHLGAYMAVNLSPVFGAGAQLFTNDGVPLAGGLIYTYAAGTSTPAAVYTSSLGSIAHSNPIVLDSSGRVPSGEIWMTDNVSYKFIVKDVNLVLIGTYDNLVGINSNFVSFTSEEESQIATQAQTVFTLTTMQYQPTTNNLLVFVNGSKQIVGQNYTETSETVITFADGLNVGDVVDFTTSVPIAGNATSANNVSYNEGCPGSVNTTVEFKLQETISVLDFGADATGVTDSSTSFQNAIDCLTYEGGKILVPSGIWKLDTQLNWGGKNIYWDISVGANFTGLEANEGVGKFPAMLTNTDQVATGPYLRSYCTTGPNATSGGVGAGNGVFNIEIIQEASITNKDSVGQYLGAAGYSTDPDSWMWAQNIVATAYPGCAGRIAGIELDVGKGSTDPNCFVTGLQINGAGIYKVDTAIEITHQVGYEFGININACDIAIIVAPNPGELATATGLLMGINGSIKQNGVPLCLSQFVNGNDTIYIEQTTNTSPTGGALRIVNQGNTAEIWKLDINGNVTMPDGALRAKTVGINGASSAANGGELKIGSTTSGSAGGLIGYFNCYLGATPIKIPYYAA